MSIDRAAVTHIARLARLRITESDKEKLAGELSDIMNWIEQLQEVETATTQPMSSVIEMALKMRPDIVDDGGKADDVLANASETADGHYVTNKVIE